MSKIRRVYRCPDCGGKIRVDDDVLPKFCIHCGTNLEDDDTPIPFSPRSPAIGTSKGKAVDATYRQMEQASIDRAEAAGAPGLKMTNMKDGLRPGDVSAPPVNNIVTQTMAAYKEAAGYDPWQGSVKSELQQVKMGPQTGNGSVALAAIQSANNAAPRAPKPQASVGGISAGWGGGVR